MAKKLIVKKPKVSEEVEKKECVICGEPAGVSEDGKNFVCEVCGESWTELEVKASSKVNKKDPDEVKTKRQEKVKKAKNRIKEASWVVEGVYGDKEIAQSVKDFVEPFMMKHNLNKSMYTTYAGVALIKNREVKVRDCNVTIPKPTSGLKILNRGNVEWDGSKAEVKAEPKSEKVKAPKKVVKKSPAKK